MTRHALLNNVTHKDLRVITRYGARVRRRRRHASARFRPNSPSCSASTRSSSAGTRQRASTIGRAARASRRTKTCFCEHGRWNADYVPGIVARGPFLIGFQEQRSRRRTAPGTRDPRRPGSSARQPRRKASRSSCRTAGNSPYLDHIATVLRGIRDGAKSSKAMFAAFAALDLIEPVKLDVKLDEEHGVQRRRPARRSTASGSLHSTPPRSRR